MRQAVLVGKIMLGSIVSHTGTLWIGNTFKDLWWQRCSWESYKRLQRMCIL